MIICLDYVLRTSVDLMKENDVTQKRKQEDDNLESIMDAEYGNNAALLTNTPGKLESLLQSLQQTASVTSLYVNLAKTEFMCFEKYGAIFTLNDF